MERLAEFLEQAILFKQLEDGLQKRMEEKDKPLDYSKLNKSMEKNLGVQLPPTVAINAMVNKSPTPIVDMIHNEYEKRAASGSRFQIMFNKIAQGQPIGIQDFGLLSQKNVDEFLKKI